MQPLAHRLRTGREQEPTAQHLTDAFDPEGGVLLFKLNDLFGDRRRKLGGTFTRHPVLQPGFPLLPILADPAAQTTMGHPHLIADLLLAEPFLQT